MEMTMEKQKFYTKLIAKIETMQIGETFESQNAVLRGQLIAHGWVYDPDINTYTAPSGQVIILDHPGDIVRLARWKVVSPRYGDGVWVTLNKEGSPKAHRSCIRSYNSTIQCGTSQERCADYNCYFHSS